MKNYLVVLLSLILLVTLSSCGQVEAPENITEENQPLADTSIDDYIGLWVEDAQAKAQENNTTLRVVEQDGTPLPATKDYRPGRINAVTQDGIIVSYTVE